VISWWAGTPSTVTPPGSGATLPESAELPAESNAARGLRRFEERIPPTVRYGNSAEPGTGRAGFRVVVTVLLVVAGALACGSRSDGGLRAARASAPRTGPRPDAGPAPVVVRFRVERRTSDPATRDFEEVVRATLADPRGWQRAGFVLVADPAAEHQIVLAEGPEVDRLCRPYETFGTYSCQLGPVVALNADRWRRATPQWTGDLADYRVMLVNHEVGHLLGQKHPAVQCPGAGQPAPVMAQQSTELRGCRANPWPLDSEIERAARHDLPLAPPFER
jgi:hypothetical protein